MDILFLGIGVLIMGVLVGLLMWIERIESFHGWQDYQEQCRFKQEQEKRNLINETYFLE